MGGWNFPTTLLVHNLGFNSNAAVTVKFNAVINPAIREGIDETNDD
jgi:hypothetical protein